MLSDVLDRDDLESMGAVFLGDRDIFAADKAILFEPMAGLIVDRAGEIVMEGPAPARPANEMADIVRLFRTEADDPAQFAVLAPRAGVKMSAGVERHDKHIATSRTADGMALFAGQFQSDATEVRRKFLLCARCFASLLRFTHRVSP